MLLPLVLVVPKYPAPVALATATEIASGKMASAASNIVKQVCCINYLLKQILFVFHTFAKYNMGINDFKYWRHQFGVLQICGSVGLK